MTSLKATILATLNADTALVTVFTGGFFDADSLPNDGLTMTTILKETDGVTIKPTGVLRWREANPVAGPNYAVRRYLEVYLYDDVSHGRENIDYGKSRLWQLLHQTYISGTDNEGFAYLVWVGDMGEAPKNERDDALMANMGRSRYQIDMTRKPIS
jgi:hypothetical protein